MTGKSLLPALIALTLLAGCSSTPDAPSSKAPAPAAAAEDVDASQLSDPKADLDARCDADSVQNLIGQPITKPLVEKARDTAKARYVRITKPDEAVTLDYNGQRLNIDTSEAGSILRINCG